MPDTMITTADTAKVAPPAFSPSAFVDQVVEAVLPFVDGDNTKEGVTAYQFVEALKSLFGGFTVRDAVIARFMLEPDSNTDADDCEGDNARKHALHEAREALISFITNADASSPECAMTRIYIAEREEDGLGTAPHSNLHKVMRRDVKHVRRGRFDGRRFADTDKRDGGWVPWSMIKQPAAAIVEAEAAER